MNTFMNAVIFTLLLGVAFATSGCTYNKQVNKTAKEPATVQFIRNATMKIQYGGITFLTDPMLSEQATLPGFLTPDQLVNPTAKLPMGKNDILAGTEIVLLSHTHIHPEYTFDDLFSDHMDPVALKVLDKDLPVYLQPYDVEGMKHMGFKNLHPIEHEVTIGNVTITRFEGLHADIDALVPAMGESSGYVLSAPGESTILWTGDTLLTEGVKNAIRVYQPDVIILHSGGAWWPLDDKGNKSQLVMGAEEAVEIAKMAPTAKIIAIHMEALDHCPVTRKELRSLVDSEGIEVERFAIPEDGESVKL